jgi:hypothetical protein
LTRQKLQQQQRYIHLFFSQKLQICQRLHQYPPKQKPQLCQELLRLLFYQWLKKFLLKLNKTLPQFRKSGMR